MTAAVMTALRAANERRTHTSMHTQTWAGRGGGGGGGGEVEIIFTGSCVGGVNHEVGRVGRSVGSENEGAAKNRIGGHRRTR